jgi:hypothetical protein
MEIFSIFWLGKWTWYQAQILAIKKLLEFTIAVAGTMAYQVIGNPDEGLRKLPCVGLGISH